MDEQTQERICPHCSQPHPLSAQFCPNTGKDLAAETSGTCPNCGRDIQPQWVRCPACATVLRPEAVTANPASSSAAAAPGLPLIWIALPLGLVLCLAFGSWLLWGSPGIWRQALAMVVPPTGTLIPSPTVTSPPTSAPPPSVTPLPPTATLPPTPSPTPTATLAPTLAPAFIWNFDVIQRAQAVGYFSSLVLDAQDNLHVGSFQDNYDIVWYGSDETGSWEFEYVVGGSDTGFNLSLALDSEGNPHFGYHMLGRQVSPEIRYVYWTGSLWTQFRVFESYAANTDVSLALNADDQPQITYLDGYTFNIRYVSYTQQNGWAFDTIDTGNPEGQTIPLVLDAGGTPHVVYQGGTGGLYYATKQGNTWTREVVDPATGAGYYAALALDVSGQPVIAYYDRQERALLFARRTADIWEISLIDAAGDVGQFPSLVVDALGQVYVAYYDATNTALKFAHGRNGQWNLYTVDNAGNVGKWNSLVVKIGGFPYITYLDEDNEDLKLAWAIPANP